MKRFGFLLMGVLLVASATALADSFSDTGLQGLKYRGDGTSEYVAGSPGYAYLSVPDSGINGQSAVVYVTDSMATLGNLSTFAGNFTDSNFIGPNGTAPYWVIWLSTNNCATYPTSNCLTVYGMGGSTIDGSSAIHVVDPAGGTSTYWGDSLSSIYNVSYNGTTLGQMPIYEAGVEIGTWANGSNVIPASVEVDSITLGPVPEPGSLMLMGSGLLGLVGAARRRFLKA